MENGRIERYLGAYILGPELIAGNWLEMLEALYMVFTLRPWHKNISRAIKKEKKLYFLG